MSLSYNFLAANWPVADWFVKLPLYSPVDIGSNSSSAVKAILTSTLSVDFYCPSCKKDSTFQGILSADTQNSVASEMMAIKSFGIASGFWSQTIFSKQLACPRAGHKATFYFQVEDGKLVKVGQYPSIADIHYGERLDFSVALGETRTREIDKAVELAAQGKGLGALFYLKKLVDSLVQDIHAGQALTTAPGESYQHRFASLAAQQDVAIPQFLLQHPELYAVLDRDLQSLSEEECLQHVDGVKATVFFLADQKVAQARLAKRQVETQALLSKAGNS